MFKLPSGIGISKIFGEVSVSVSNPSLEKGWTYQRFASLIKCDGGTIMIITRM